MKPTNAVKSITTELRSRLNVPVRTSGQTGDRPVPAVILDDWSIEEMNFHNTAFVGETDTLDVDGDGSDEFARWFRFYYDMRVELVARDADDVGAHTLLGNVQDAMRAFQIDPSIIHDHVNTVEPGSSGNISYQFTQPKETELTQTMTLTTFHQVSQTNYDTIADVQETFNLT